MTTRMGREDIKKLLRKDPIGREVWIEMIRPLKKKNRLQVIRIKALEQELSELKNKKGV